MSRARSQWEGASGRSVAGATRLPRPRPSAVAVAGAAVRAHCHHLLQAGAMVKLAAKCLLAGESGSPAPTRPAGHRGLERAPWGGARPAAQAAWLPTASRRGAAPPEKRWGKRRRERRAGLGCLGTGTAEVVCVTTARYPHPPATWSRAEPREGVRCSWIGWNPRTGSEKEGKKTKQNRVFLHCGKVDAEIGESVKEAG